MSSRGESVGGGDRKVHGVVLAGGSGTRLREFTRSHYGHEIPKQYCDFGRGRSLLLRTLDRIAPIAPSHRSTVIVAEAHEEHARAQLGGQPGLETIVQRVDRGTGVGALIPLLHVEARDPEALVLLTAADHAVADPVAFRRVLREGLREVERSPQCAVLLGVEPDEASTEYGWIEVGATRPGTRVAQVAGFVEKPPADLARSLFVSGTALWNTMILVGRVRTLISHFAAHAPLVDALRPLVSSGSPREWDLRAACFRKLDYSRDVLGTQPEGSLLVLRGPSRLGWSDLGTPDRLKEWLEHGVAPRRSVGSRVLHALS